MSEIDKSDKKTVYEPMWMPMKVFGLPRDYFYLIGAACPVMWGLTRSMLVGFISFILLYVFGFVMSNKDQEFFLVWLTKVLRVKNKTVTHCGKKGSMYKP
jgi:type IV secretory pathway VirB3-like protein